MNRLKLSKQVELLRTAIRLDAAVGNRSDVTEEMADAAWKAFQTYTLSNMKVGKAEKEQTDEDRSGEHKDCENQKG